LVNSGGTRSYIFNYTINVANTWEQKTVTIAGDTTGTWLTTNAAGIQLRLDLGSGSNQDGTASAWQAADKMRTISTVRVVSSAGATFYITGVQLEAGTVASSFERRDYGRELMMCQRYYEAGETTQLHATVANAYLFVPFKVTKRVAPTVTRTGDGAISSSTTGTTVYGPNLSGFYWFQAASTNFIGGNYTASAEL
jgi:hypothetical protein